MNLERQEPDIPAELATEIDHRRYKAPSRKAEHRRDYTEEQKTLALAIYAETGSAQTASEQSGIPRTTIVYWVETDPEIDAKFDALRLAIREKLGYRYAEMAVLAADELRDRIINGDYHVDKEGNKSRRPLTGQALAWISSMCADKHALITAAPVKKTEDASLKRLADGLLAAIETRTRKAKAVDAVQHETGRNSAD